MLRLPIAVAKGDGIGPEIMSATLKIFEAAKIPLDYKFVEMGKSVYLNGRSDGMTPEAKKLVEKYGLLFKGPMETPKGTGAKSVNVTARKVWNAYANKRVFKSLPGVQTVFSRAGIPIDLTLFRENIEDTYGGIEYLQTHDVAKCHRLITRPGSYQVHHEAFRAAKIKNAKRITCVHKANIMKITDGMFLETFYEVAKEYPELKADDIIVDDVAMKLVMYPQSFDVLVLPNLQGDIISDLCAGLVGGLGMAPSANLGEEISIFEAVHGTAPDIAGKNLANPTALILSGQMMLRHLGMADKAQYIQDALNRTLAEGKRTRDLVQLPGCTPLGTQEFADAVISHLCADATKETVSLANLDFKPPSMPAKNKIHVSPRDLKIESTVGVDVFVDSDLQPSELANIIQKAIGSKNKLTMMSNRGTQVWPTGSLFTECVNYYRCRLESADGQGRKDGDWLEVSHAVSKAGIRVTAVDMLLKIGDKRGYSLAQGQ